MSYLTITIGINDVDIITLFKTAEVIKSDKFKIIVSIEPDIVDENVKDFMTNLIGTILQNLTRDNSWSHTNI